MASKGETLSARFGALKTDRLFWHDTWEELADYLLPREGGFTTPITKGERLNAKIYDSTGPHALQIAASGLYARATNPASKWFNLKVGKDFKDDREVQIWLEDTRDRMSAVINTQLPEVLFQTYQSMLGFGTAIMFIDEDPKTIIRGHAFKLKDCYLQQDGNGDITKVYRRKEFTLAQAEDVFGTANLPSEMHELMRGTDKHTNLQMHEFFHYVGPRVGFNPSKSHDPLNMPMESVWVHASSNKVVKDSGFQEDPYMTPRLDVIPTETYGRGPGLQALPDIRSVNQLMYFQLDGAGLALRPPLDVPEDAYASPLQLFPGAENENQDRSGRKATAMFDVAGNLGISFQMVEERRAAIRQTFFNDQLQLINNRDMTAFEVDKRSQQQMMLMGPWQGRIEKELLNKIIDRVFPIMERRSLFAEAPKQLDDVEIKVTYESPLARAQRRVDVAAIDQTMEFIMPLAQFGVQDNFNMDKMAVQRADFVGLAEDMKVSEEDRDARRQRDAEQAQMAAQQQEQQLISQQIGNAQAAVDVSKAAEETE